MNAKGFLAACVVLITLGCTSEDAPAENTDASRGAELLAPLKKDLKQALIAGMKEGPQSAISVCKIEAPAIADALSVDGIKIGRTSHRLRNPANAAPDWVDAILQSYLSEGGNRAPRTVSLPNNREGYVEPIMLEPLCVACHGKSLAPAVAASIKEAYPADAATGFEVGDLRGVFWVEYAAAD